MARTSDTFADKMDKAILGAPVIGDIMRKAALARYARVLSTTFAAGVPLVDALTSVSGAVGNAIYRDAVLKVRDDVSTGMPMNGAMKATGVFTNMMIQMVAIGEESGALDAMLDKAADYYEEEVDAAVDGFNFDVRALDYGFLRDCGRRHVGRALLANI
jgi:type IV pilus assembly protein PilC